MSDFDEKDEDEKEIDELEDDESEEEEEESPDSESTEAEESEEEPEEVEREDRPKRPKLTSKERRERRKAIIERERREKEELKERINSQNREIQTLHELVGNVVEKTNARDFSDIETRLEYTVRRYNEADQYIQQSQFIIQKALDEGDTATVGKIFAEVEKAREIKLQSQGEYNALKTAKDKFESSQKRADEPRESVARQGVDKVREASLKKQWVEKNPWFDGSSRHPDSVAALLINKDLIDEGLKPDTDAFWSELTSRVRQNIPHRYKQPAAKPKQIVAGKETTAVRTGSDNEGALPVAFRKVLNDRYGRDKSNPERKRAVQYYLDSMKEKKNV